MALTNAHKLFFTYCYNIGAPDCLLPTAGLTWHPTRPPVNLDEWHPGVGPAEPAAFTTVGTWQNNGNDIEIGGETYYWSKHVNFRKVLEVAGAREQPIELATNLTRGPDYDRAIAGGFTLRRSCRCRWISTTIASTSAVARRVHRLQGYVRPPALRMVQRSDGMLSGGGTAGDYSVHRV